MSLQKNIKLYLMAIIVSAANIIEFYNFILFPSLAIYISKVFFTINSPLTSLLAAYGISLVGYIARPLGALILGNFGDRYGRKNVLAYSILGTSLSSLVICILPSASSIGVAAPCLLIAMRFLQGLCVSGEEGGAVVYLAETIGMHKVGFASGMVLSGVFLGILLGLLNCAVLEHFLSSSQMLAWGWRLPFLLAFFSGLIFFYMRINIKETEIFTAYKSKKLLLSKPITEVFTKYKQVIVKLLLIGSVYSSLTCVLMIVLPNSLSQFGVSKLIFIPPLLIITILLPWVGSLSDQIGAKKIMLVSFYALFPILYLVMQLLYNLNLYVLGLFILSVLILSISASIFPLIVEIFPAEVRCTGVSFVFNTAVCIFSGLFPILSTYVTSKLAINYGWVLVVGFFAILSLIALIRLSSNSTIYSSGKYANL